MHIKPNTFVFQGAQIFTDELRDLENTDIYDATSSSEDSESDTRVDVTSLGLQSVVSSEVSSVVSSAVSSDANVAIEN